MPARALFLPCRFRLAPAWTSESVSQGLLGYSDRLTPHRVSFSLYIAGVDTDDESIAPEGSVTFQRTEVAWAVSCCVSSNTPPYLCSGTIVSYLCFRCSHPSFPTPPFPTPAYVCPCTNVTSTCFHCFISLLHRIRHLTSALAISSVSSLEQADIENTCASGVYPWGTSQTWHSIALTFSDLDGPALFLDGLPMGLVCAEAVELMLGGPLKSVPLL